MAIFAVQFLVLISIPKGVGVKVETNIVLIILRK